MIVEDIDGHIAIVKAALLDSSNALVRGTLPESATNGLAALHLLESSLRESREALERIARGDFGLATSAATFAHEALETA